MLYNLWLKLRPYWLVAKRDLKMWITPCKQCGALGAYPCSIAACIPMCNPCQLEESIRLDRRIREITKQ